MPAPSDLTGSVNVTSNVSVTLSFDYTQPNGTDRYDVRMYDAVVGSIGVRWHRKSGTTGWSWCTMWTAPLPHRLLIEPINMALATDPRWEGPKPVQPTDFRAILDAVVRVLPQCKHPFEVQPAGIPRHVTHQYSGGQFSGTGQLCDWCAEFARKSGDGYDVRPLKRARVIAAAIEALGSEPVAPSGVPTPEAAECDRGSRCH